MLYATAMELLAIVAMAAAGLSSRLLLVAAILSLPLQYLASRIRPSRFAHCPG